MKNIKASTSYHFPNFLSVPEGNLLFNEKQWVFRSRQMILRIFQDISPYLYLSVLLYFIFLVANVMKQDCPFIRVTKGCKSCICIDQSLWVIYAHTCLWYVYARRLGVWGYLFMFMINIHCMIWGYAFMYMIGIYIQS